MKLLYTLALLFLLLPISNSYAQEYFEGVITYDVTYESVHPAIEKELLEYTMGSSFTAYILEDRYTSIYNTKGETGWTKVTVRLDEGYTYTEYEKSDTIVKSKFNARSENLISLQKHTSNPKEVMGSMCNYVTMTVEDTDPNVWYTLHTGTYYYSPKYALNPTYYKEYTNGHWNQYVAEAKAVSIYNINEYRPYFTSYSKATAIEEKQIDISFFEPNPKKVVVEE